MVSEYPFYTLKMVRVLVAHEIAPEMALLRMVQSDEEQLAMRLSVRMRGHLITTKRPESSRLGQLDERGAIQMSSSTNCASQTGAQTSRTGLKLSQGCSVSCPIQTPHIVQCCISIQTTNVVGISTIETCQNCMVYYPVIHNISQILPEKGENKYNYKGSYKSPQSNAMLRIW